MPPPPIKTSLIFTLLAACQLSSIGVAQAQKLETEVIDSESFTHRVMNYSDYEFSPSETNSIAFTLTNECGGLIVERNKVIFDGTGQTFNGADRISILDGPYSASASGDLSVQSNILTVSNIANASAARTAHVTLADPTGWDVDYQPEKYQATLNGNELIAQKVTLHESYTVSLEVRSQSTPWAVTSSNNNLEITNQSAIEQAYAAQITLKSGAAPKGSIQMENNSVTIDDSSAGYTYAAGITDNHDNDLIPSIIVRNNHIDIKNSSLGKINPERGVVSAAQVLANTSEMKEVTGNSVTMEGSEALNVAGAISYFDDVKTVDVSNNGVNLINSTVSGAVFGAVDSNPAQLSNGDYSGGIDLGNFITAKGVNKVGYISGFDNLTLKLQNTNKSEGAGVDEELAVINITGENHQISFEDRKITLEATEDLTLANGEVLNLITVSGAGSSVVLPEGFEFTFAETFKITKYEIMGNGITYDQGDTLAITITDATAPGDSGSWEVTTTPTDNSKTLAESYLGSAALIGLGTEYIADEGLAMIVDSAKLPGKNVFGAIYGGTGKYHTGSRLDLDSATLITGISAMTEKQKLAISAFVEAGWGDSEGHVNQAHAKADHNVYSMGTAMRFFTDSPWYFDASARLGVARFDYTGNFATESVKFDHSGIYAALHGAVGYAYPITEDTTLDSYLRYSFTYLEGGSENLHNRAQDTFKMDSIRASAFRVGTRVKGYIGENQWLNYRVGAAYEKVVDGDANTKIDGMSIDAPSLNGDTGILEIGLAKRPTINSPWGVDVTLKGYAGDRDGLYGSATLNYVF